jgi:hypothetical protein
MLPLNANAPSSVLDCLHSTPRKNVMDRYRKGRRIPPSLLTGLLALGLSACAQPSDKAAAIADAAPPGEAQQRLKRAGYPAMRAGPAFSASALVDQIHTLARTLRGYADTEPDRVQKALGVALPDDADGRRRGIRGTTGNGTYSWAVWKRSTSSAGNSVQLSLEPPDACLGFDALKAPLLAEGFKMYVPTFGDDDRITFYRLVESSLTLYVAVSVDRRDAPSCARTVMLELEPSDD